MRSTVFFLSLTFAGAPIVFAQAPALINPTGQPQQAGAAAPLPADPSIDVLLDALDQRGQSLKDFTANVRITEGNENITGITTRTGQVWFQKKGADDGRIRVLFDKRIEGRIAKADKVEYLLDNGWLIDRDYRKRTETRRQVLKPGEKVNLLKLGEGPFPLPIGQKKEDVYKLFDVTKAAPGKNDPADTIHLILKPKPGTQFARKFSAIDVWVDRKSHFPARIDTDNPDQSDAKKTELTDVQINPPGGLKDGDFQLPKVDQTNWNIQTEPYKE
ncbi:MAG: hypothetical protein JWN24_4758 [Phycisphaerales bacterium]|nr:hypothetical protein [Phycisphaerales bacterium]